MEKLTVIKVGGKIVEEEATLYKLLDDFAAIEGYKVLVHGADARPRATLPNWVLKSKNGEWPPHH